MIPYSVIIPTIGRADINLVIENLFMSTFPPSEILLCVPDNNSIKEKFNDLRVKIIICNIYNQVKQREHGVENSKFEVILQLDDDVIVSKNTIENLFYFLNDNNALAPVYFFNNDKNKIIHSEGLSFDTSLNSLVKNILYKIFHNLEFGVKKSGKVSKLSFSFGVGYFLDKPSTKEVDWLPGGIVLTKKKNFQFLKDYNLDGKAYTEDIINSYYRNKAGIKQLVVLNSKVFTDQINKSSNKITKKFFSEKINEYKARLFYTKLVNGNIILFNVWWLIYLFNSIFKKIKCR
jgi:hypothetical protein